MTFLTTIALAIAAFVVAPYLAHRLRRRKAEDLPFPPARLAEATRPQARRRAKVEDRTLLATRALAVLMLAVLGATPLVRCSRLSLRRTGGGSLAMAIVVDDSMSMRAAFSPTRSRFERARQGGLELLASAREGDAIAIVLAGAPVRIGLAPTTDLGAARSAIEALTESDRPTDLEGALAIARDLLGPLPQADRRVVVLSDLADGQPDAPPLADTGPYPVWVALPELRSEGADCAILRAERNGARVKVETRCGAGASAAGRDVVVVDTHGATLGHAAIEAGARTETTVLLPSEDANAATAHLTGSDAVTTDDTAPVVRATGRASIAVVADAVSEAVATGGAPIAEQALSALKLDVDVRPIPAFPERAEDLAGTLGVLIDDPPGLTPEQRRALAAYLDGGGVVLLTLGSHAATAPLGASFEPVLGRPFSWRETTAKGADVASVSGELASSAQSLLDLDAPRRSVLAVDDVAAFEPVAKWTDGAPLIARRAIGRGGAWVVTLPVSLDASDLALRPAFLALLEAWTRDARDHESIKQTAVGAVWRFPGTRDVEIQGPSGSLPISPEDSGVRFVPPLIGLYRVTVDGRTEVRVAMPSEREIDLRPRALASTSPDAQVGERRTNVDISGQIALALLAITALEMALRVWLRR